MKTKLIQIDSFTSVPFKGNPAAVCFPNDEVSDSWMQDVAAEMNLAETAFLQLRGDGGYDLRWFTPVCEVDLCGHATLASAHALWDTGMLAPDADAKFYTKSGLLTARKKGDWIEMDFPVIANQPVDTTGDFELALGAAPLDVRKHQFGFLAEFESERVIREMRPDLARLAQMPAAAVIVTSVSASNEFDFVSRMFAPAIGINEDPVTGSAHCCLGPYWKERLGKDEFTAFQASKRGGVVKVFIRGERVLLHGQAVTVFTGELV
jgi:PhzF family phenazine biosynthesis protein